MNKKEWFQLFSQGLKMYQNRPMILLVGIFMSGLFSFLFHSTLVSTIVNFALDFTIYSVILVGTCMKMIYDEKQSNLKTNS